MRDLIQAGVPRLQDLLGADVLDALRADARSARYADGRLIHRRGDHRPALSIVRSGAVRFGIVGSDGSYLETSVLGAGECYGEFTLFAGLPRAYDATAVGDTVVDEVPGRRAIALAAELPALSQALLAVSLLRAHALAEFMDDLRRLPLPVRVAKFLLTLAGNGPEIRLRQEDLAFTFGVSRVSMGKVLATLEGDGLLRRGYGRLTVPDVDGLASWVARRALVEPLVPGAVRLPGTTRKGR